QEDADAARNEGLPQEFRAERGIDDLVLDDLDRERQRPVAQDRHDPVDLRRREATHRAAADDAGAARDGLVDAGRRNDDAVEDDREELTAVLARVGPEGLGALVLEREADRPAAGVVGRRVWGSGWA